MHPSDRGVLSCPQALCKVHTEMEPHMGVQLCCRASNRVALVPPEENRESQPGIHGLCPVLAALGGDAGLVRCCLPSQREERSHNVSPVRHRDPAGDRHQQRAASPEAASGHPGDGLAHQPLGTTHLADGTFHKPPDRPSVGRGHIFPPFPRLLGTTVLHRSAGSVTGKRGCVGGDIRSNPLKQQRLVLRHKDH